MRIIAYKKIAEFINTYSDAKAALDDWYFKTEGTDWLCFAEIKSMFNSVDSVGNKSYVFNIKSNSYRLITLILFEPKIVYIRGIYTHTDYNKIKDCSKI
jgi:mRNA interferase HigB